MEKYEFFCRAPGNYDPDIASSESGLACADPSLTKQSFAEEVDINTIVRRFNLTGELPQDVRVPEFRDFEDIYDYHSACNVIAQAHEAFDSMPAEVRARFKNDPGEFLDFTNDSNNIPEMIKLGLAIPVPGKEPVLDLNQSATVASATEAEGKGA